MKFMSFQHGITLSVSFFFPLSRSMDDQNTELFTWIIKIINFYCVLLRVRTIFWFDTMSGIRVVILITLCERHRRYQCY